MNVGAKAGKAAMQAAAVIRKLRLSCNLVAMTPKNPQAVTT